MHAGPSVAHVWTRHFSHSVARLLQKQQQQQARRRPSPLVQASCPPPTRLLAAQVPKGLFPDLVAWQPKPKSKARSKLKREPQLVLVPTTQSRHSGITILRRATGMHSYVQIISTPTADTPGSCVLLHFDNRRYLFGRVAEGTQRLMVQRRTSLSKVHDIFLTGRIDWESTGGLLGMILSLADLKAIATANIEQFNEERRSRGSTKVRTVESRLNIHGGKNLVHSLATARRFILRKALPVHPREVRHDPRPPDGANADADYEDENIRVWSLLASNEPAKTGTPEHQSTKKRKLRPFADPDATAGADSDEVGQNIREAVVRDMFCSDWKLDALHETSLRKVQLPAKVFVRNDKGHIEQYAGPLPDRASERPDIKVLVRQPWPASKIEQLPETQPSTQSLCYIVKGHTRRGKFDVETATRLGVVKTDFKKLTAGETVHGKDGVVVTPEMVLAPPIEGHGFAVVDIPSTGLIDAVLNRPEWSNPEIMKGIDVMYWILGESLTWKDAKVVHFMQARGSIKHVLLGKQACPNPLALQGAASQLIKMSRIDPGRFSLPAFDNTQPPLSFGEKSELVAEAGRAGATFQLAPKATPLPDGTARLMDTRYPIHQMLTETPKVLQLADRACKKISDAAFLAEVDESQRDLPCPDAEIIPLGTGSALPSKYRNVSATLVRVPGWGSYLLDCGENTLGQLRRCLGYEGTDKILKDLRAIYISHVHADHHLGTVSIIARWRKLLAQLPPDRKLAIIASPRYQDFIREFQSVQPLCPNHLLPITLRKLGPNGILTACFPDGRSSSSACASHNLPRIEACLVDHCFEASAVVLTFPDTGLKLAYSGDCRPSEDLARLGRGAHLLIHECTFEDSLAGDALAKKHSTMSEALEVGRRMAARRILLTHFSQRYPKLPVVDDAALKGPGGKEDGKGNNGGKGARDVEVLFAFDMMRVKLGEFKQAKQFLPALRELLEEGERREGREEEGEGE